MTGVYNTTMKKHLSMLEYDYRCFNNVPYQNGLAAEGVVPVPVNMGTLKPPVIERSMSSMGFLWFLHTWRSTTPDGASASWSRDVIIDGSFGNELIEFD